MLVLSAWGSLSFFCLDVHVFLLQMKLSSVSHSRSIKMLLFSYSGMPIIQICGCLMIPHYLHRLFFNPYFFIFARLHYFRISSRSESLLPTRSILLLKLLILIFTPLIEDFISYSCLFLLNDFYLLSNFSFLPLIDFPIASICSSVFLHLLNFYAVIILDSISCFIEFLSAWDLLQEDYCILFLASCYLLLVSCVLTLKSALWHIHLFLMK